MTNHELKTDRTPFADTIVGDKNFEIRCNDRDFQRGDVLHLRQTEHTGEEMADGAPLIYTGWSVLRAIRSVTKGIGYGVMPGFVVLDLCGSDAAVYETPKENQVAREFELEDRYIVIKRDDLELLEPGYKTSVETIDNLITKARKHIGKPKLKGVFVSIDWPNYAATVQGIKEFAESDQERGSIVAKSVSEICPYCETKLSPGGDCKNENCDTYVQDPS